MNDLDFIKQLYSQFSHINLILGCDCAGKGFYDLGPVGGRQLSIVFFTGPRHGQGAGCRPYLEYYGSSNADADKNRGSAAHLKRISEMK